LLLLLLRPPPLPVLPTATPLTSTLTNQPTPASLRYVIDQQSILDSANLKSLDAGFVGEREASAPQMFYVYTRKKTVSYKTTTTAEKNGWLNAMNDAMNEAFSESELESKKLSEVRVAVFPSCARRCVAPFSVECTRAQTNEKQNQQTHASSPSPALLFPPSQVELRPVMLEQAALQFARCKQIVANLQTSGFLPVEKVHTLKKGYLKFQRAQYEEQEFYASLSPDYKVTTKQFKKYVGRTLRLLRLRLRLLLLLRPVLLPPPARLHDVFDCESSHRQLTPRLSL